MAAARANEVEIRPAAASAWPASSWRPTKSNLATRGLARSLPDEGLSSSPDHDRRCAAGEGDARELTCAIQDLRKQVGLDFDESIELADGGDLLAAIEPYLAGLADTPSPTRSTASRRRPTLSGPPTGKRRRGLRFGLRG